MHFGRAVHDVPLGGKRGQAVQTFGEIDWEGDRVEETRGPEPGIDTHRRARRYEEAPHR
jgi:hypothetical protein